MNSEDAVKMVYRDLAVSMTAAGDILLPPLRNSPADASAALRSTRLQTFALHPGSMPR